MPGVFFAGFASDRQPRALRDTLPFVVDATEKTIRLRARAHDGQVAHAEPRETRKVYDSYSSWRGALRSLWGLSRYELIEGPGKPGKREPYSSRALVDQIACRQLLLGARVKRPQRLEKVTRRCA